MKGLPQKAPDFNDTQGIENSILPVANTTEISPTTLKVLEELAGRFHSYRFQDDAVDIIININRPELVSVRIDSPDQHLIEFIESLKHSEMIGIFRLDAPQKYFIRRVPTKVKEWKQPKMKV